MSFLKKGPIIKVPNPGNTPRNKGIKINEKGIKYLKFSSNVKEYDIQ